MNTNIETGGTHRLQRPIFLLSVGATLLASIGFSGCATKGFVRRELETVRGEMATGQVELSDQMTQLRNSVDEALARAEVANGLAGQARDLALGKTGFREVGRYTVHFPFDGDEIDTDGEIALEEVTSRVESHPEYLVDVYGYTDSNGTTRYNYELGRRRAESIVRGLAERVPGSLHRFAAVSYGESQPPDAPSEPSEQRRVEISLVERITSPDQGDSITLSN